MRNVFQVTLAAALIIIGSLSPANAGDAYVGARSAEWTAGGVVVISPKYEGSKSHRVIGIPYIFPSFNEASNMVAIRGADDVRLRLINHGAFVAGPLLGYKFDREASDGRKLRGWGDVDGGLVLGAFAGYRLLPWLTFDLSYHRTVTGDVDGGQLRFGLEYEAPVSDRLTLLARVGATYADDDYMAGYFGVTTAQAAASAAFANLPQYDAGAGFKDVHVGVGARIQIDPRWALMIGSRYGRLVGDAADSPVIETKDQLSGFANLTFKFGSGW